MKKPILNLTITLSNTWTSMIQGCCENHVGMVWTEMGTSQYQYVFQKKSEKYKYNENI